MSYYHKEPAEAVCDTVYVVTAVSTDGTTIPVAVSDGHTPPHDHGKILLDLLSIWLMVVSLCVGGDSLLQDTPKMSDLMSQVAAKTKDKWFQVGIQLDIDMATLLSYEAQSRDPMRCYTSVFVEWKRDHKLPYTWATIIGALESNAVTEVAVANEVREWLAHRQL